ncbi:MAG: phytase [Gammaproteobacteria bacterium]|nr:phytase [Gammaproteobacteria bacterium]
MPNCILRILAAALCSTLALGCQAFDAAHARLDEERNEILLYGAGKDGEEAVRHSLGDVVLEGICEGSIGGSSYLYAYGDDGYLTQWQLFPNEGRLAFVRAIPGVVSVEDCIVDDAGLNLYVLEEAVGLWRFGAHPESEPGRELIERYAPAGSIDGDADTVRIRDNTLIVGATRLPLPKASAPRKLARPTVAASAETDPVQYSGDAADDVAIWRNPQSPEASLVLAADKRFGLRVYALSGAEVESIAAGRINNIDLRTLPDHPEYAAIATASNRTEQSISVFAISHSGDVTWLREAEIATGLDDPYGLCMYRGKDALFVFVNDKDGRFQQWQLTLRGMKVSARLARTFSAHDQPEGCVGDDAHARLFFGVEDHGVMLIAAEPDAATDVTRIAEVDDKILFADVEGMDIYKRDGEGFLVVSSQGDNSFALYSRLPPYRYLGSFVIGSNANNTIDGVSETDGLAVHSGNFGSAFPLGLLVVQDGHNVSPSENQNFKLIDWREVSDALELR